MLPVRSSVQLSVDRGVDYIYFLRTTSQRKLFGDGTGRVDLIGARAAAGLEGSYRRTFSRPNFEVGSCRTSSSAGRRARGSASGWTCGSKGPRHYSTCRTGKDFRDTDLRRSLSRDTYHGRLIIAYRLTPKTSFLIEADHQVDRFILRSERDADSSRFGAGFEIVSTTRLSGRANGGVRSFRLRRVDTTSKPADVFEPYVTADLTYHFGLRTRLGAAYLRDLYYSGVTAMTGTPTIRMESYRLRLEKGLVGALDLRLFGGLTRLRSDGPIRVEIGPDETVIAVRDDEVWEGGADLGYTFRRHPRIGVATTYMSGDPPSTISESKGCSWAGPSPLLPDTKSPKRPRAVGHQLLWSTERIDEAPS